MSPEMLMFGGWIGMDGCVDCYGDLVIKWTVIPDYEMY